MRPNDGWRTWGTWSEPPDVPVVDAWMQQPTEEFLGHEMFESIRRWQGEAALADVPFEWTVQA